MTRDMKLEAKAEQAHLFIFLYPSEKEKIVIITRNKFDDCICLHNEMDSQIIINY